MLALAAWLRRRESTREAVLVLAAAALFATAGHARFEATAARPLPPIAALTGTHEVIGVARAR